MKILVIGGTGMIGGNAALHLRAQGHDVTIAARKAPHPESAVAGLPLLIGDYAKGEITEADLRGFEGIVFAAGQDIRHKPKDADTDSFWRETQIEGVPNFAARAKAAGVKRFVQIGSYYHQVMPELAQKDPYVAARKAADEGARALADADFAAMTLNPPSIVGALAGQDLSRYARFVDWAKGNRPDIPDYGPAGGTNYMSVRSLCQAISSALRAGESGKAYLIGDENLSFTDYFQLYFDLTRSTRPLVERDAEHPLQPDAFIVPGRGFHLRYEPSAEDMALLAYDRGDVRRAMREILAMLPDALPADDAGSLTKGA